MPDFAPYPSDPAATPAAPAFPPAPAYSPTPASPAYPAPGFSPAPAANAFPPAANAFPTAPPLSPTYPTYPMAPSYDMPAAEQKSGVLGIVGFGVVLVAGIIFFIFSMSLYNAFFNIFGTAWIGTGMTPDTSNLTPEQASQIMGPVVGMIAATVIGIAGWVVSIVATAQNKGRVFGIIGIVLGVLAPFTFVIAAQISVAGH